MDRTKGATPAEWRHFIKDLGIVTALLPAVADPGAVIKSGSKLRPDQLGKIPSRYTGNEAVGFGKWTAYSASGSDADGWAKHGGYSICVQARVDGLQAVDIDIGDHDQARRVIAFLEDHLLTHLPVRYRDNSGKRLVPFSCGTAFSKKVIKTRDGNIEILGTGQQWIAAGTHPSGERYRWTRSDGAAVGLPDTDLVPRLTLREVEDMVDALQAEFGIAPMQDSRVSNAPRTEVMARVHVNDPVAKFLLENAWVHDSKADLSLVIRCPFEEGHSTGAAGDTSTLYYPAFTNGYEQGHFKCLHASCAHRSDHDFRVKCGFELALVTGEIIAPGATSAPAGGDDADIYRAAVERFLALKLPRNKAGRVTATLPHLAATLPFDTILGCAISYDTFRQVGTVAWGKEPPREITDADVVKIRERLERAPFRFMPVGKEIMRDALIAHYDRNSYDSAVAWLRSLPPWDGISRVERLLPAYLGADDTPYSRAVGRYLMTALVARMLAAEAPVKADMVPILVGEQGALKSTFLSVLAPTPREHIELDLGRSEDERARHTHGTVLVELGELQGFGKRDQNEHKVWLAKQRDVLVRKYQEAKSEITRRFICVGTTNEDEFLQDATGERRYLPVRVTKLDRDGLEAAREQLYAEALTRVELFGVDFEDAEKLAREVHGDFKVTDTWDDAIERYLNQEDTLAGETTATGRTAVTVAEVLVAAVGMDLKHIKRSDEMRAGKILKRLGYARMRVAVGAQRSWRWVKA